MALQSMTALASITLQSASASVTFSGIPQNYRDLVLVFNGTTAIADGVGSRYNGDSGNNYSAFRMTGSSAGAISDGFSAISRIIETAGNTDERTIYISNIMDYSATDKHKSVTTRSSIASNVTGIASRWANTVAISSIMVFSPGSTISSGSTINLYGRIA
jgi:hypothetical protein